MPDPYFSGETDKSMSLKSSLTAVVEILNYDTFLETDRLHELQEFFEELAYEVYHMRLKNYGYGLEVIQPELNIVSDRIYLYSRLYLEENVRELNMMVFKIFVETLNLLLAVALKYELPLRGFATPGMGARSVASSGIAARVKVKDGMILSDMLKIFNFDQIFPDEIDQKFAPALNFTSFHSPNFFHATGILKEIDAIGIYFPAKIEDYPYAEVAIYSDMLIETRYDGNMGFVCSWQNWAEKHPEKFPVEDVNAVIRENSNDEKNIFSSMWQSFAEYGIQPAENRQQGVGRRAKG